MIPMKGCGAREGIGTDGRRCVIVHAKVNVQGVRYNVKAAVARNSSTLKSIIATRSLRTTLAEAMAGHSSPDLSMTATR